MKWGIGFRILGSITLFVFLVVFLVFDTRKGILPIPSLVSKE